MYFLIPPHLDSFWCDEILPYQFGLTKPIISFNHMPHAKIIDQI